MKIDYKTKISVKFANGNSMAFLDQGYIASGDKKVFVRLYTTSDLRRVVVKMYRHHGYSFKWNDAKDLGLMQQDECGNGTLLTFDRMRLFYKTQCYYEFTIMAQLEIAFKLMNFKLL